MKDKARANLQACKNLLGADLLDPAASRLYYALFQAGVQAMANRNTKPSDLDREAVDEKWSHTLLRNNASLCRGKRSDRAFFGTLFSLRQAADYEPEPVEREEIEAHLPDVQAFVNEVTT
jgi:uncharacterized protein (UPF0332 family)